MLSLASMSRLVASVVAMPSTFILNEEAVPPISLTLLKRSFWLFSLMILNDLVMEPAVVKTVSYFKLSVLVRSKASELLMKESFLQEASKRQKEKGKRQKRKFCFFIVQIYTYLITVLLVVFQLCLVYSI